jgi:hypothetical protein
VWATDTYDMLIPYDEPTYDQPSNGFSCHSTPDHYCHGWAVVHSNRGHANELLALRMAGNVDEVPEAAVPLFSSGTEAAEHGKRDIENPSDEAKAMMTKLAGKYDRLRYA